MAEAAFDQTVGPVRTDTYRQLFDSLPIGVLNVALDGTPTLVNARAAATFGYASSDDFLADVRSMLDLWVHPHERERAAEILLQTGELRDFEVVMRRRDGARITLAVSACPLRDAQGSVVGLQVSGIDITDRVRAERRVEEAQSHASIAFWSWHLDTNDFVYTSNLPDLLGLDPQRSRTLTIADMSELAHEHDREVVAMKLSTLEPIAGRTVEVEFRITTFTGETRWLISRGRVDDDGWNVSASTQDVTRQKLAEAKLVELNEMKTEFVSLVAHDLASPLSVAIGYAEFLLSQPDEVDAAERRTFVTRIHRSLMRMRSLVGDVADVTHLELGGPTVEKRAFDLAELVRDVLDDTRSVDPLQSCELLVEEPLPAALGDAENIERVMVNLLSNAAKYAHGAEVTVKLRRANTMLEVSVHDDGPGIALADQSRLFKRFSRLESVDAEERPSGTGLGLFICKALVEAGGGKIWVASAPGHGTTFFFTVPTA